MAYFQIHNHLEFDPIFFEENKDLMNNDTCIICLEETSKKLSTCSFLNSGNVSLNKICDCECALHQECLNHWLYKSESCPICRKNMNSSIILQNAHENSSWIVEISFQNININNNVNQVALFCQQLFRLVLLCIYFGLLPTIILNITFYTIAYIEKVT